MALIAGMAPEGFFSLNKEKEKDNIKRREPESYTDHLGPWWASLMTTTPPRSCLPQSDFFKEYIMLPLQILRANRVR